MNVDKNNKGRIIIYCIIGGCVLLMIMTVIFFFTRSSDSKEEESKPPILSSQDNLTVKDMIDINGGDKTNEYRGTKNYDTIKDNTAQYNAQIEGIYGVGKSEPKSSYEESTPKTSSPKNTHNVYGDYSMWENKEPSNSRIGYSSKKKNVETSRSSEPPKFETIAEPNYSQPSPSYSTPVEKKSTQIAETNGKLISQGYASNNKSISFVILETFSLKGEQIPKGKSYAVGTIKMENNRLYARINSIKANGKVYPVSGKIVGFDGDDGLPISAGDDSGGVDGKGIVRDEAVNQVGRIPVVGGIIRRVTSGSGNSRAEADKVALSNNIECRIVIYN